MKLRIHDAKPGIPDLLVNLKYFHDWMVHDVLEIFQDQVNFSRLLLQITKDSEEIKDANTISISKMVASTFHLVKYRDVNVTKVSSKEVALNLVELLFKDQYYNQSDMWRLREHLVESVAYLDMKVNYGDMEAQVCELWAKGEKVLCGYIAEDTRVVFRSQTAVVQIFIQMSCEMWQFDNYGDLYFEKAINGFLCDLFSKWKEKKCSHDVTIVLFSRTFFNASSLDEFPESMRGCIQSYCEKSFYEDYYRVVIQNERFQIQTDSSREWVAPICIKLRAIFNSYQNDVLAYHRRFGCDIPTGSNSTAIRGNFLETLNMALNLFEKSYLDRSFDHAGQVAVIITPGAGVFEVDRELCNITKQRTIDCGVGSDLVCVGEQPLHAVPLFKFIKKSRYDASDLGDDYNVPHWMNHSFYTSVSQAHCLANCSFVPRIQIPQSIRDKITNGEYTFQVSTSVNCVDSTEKRDSNHLDFIDYDDYDDQIFKPPSQLVKSGFCPQRSKSYFTTASSYLPPTLDEARRSKHPRDRRISDNFGDKSMRKISKKSLPINITKQGYGDDSSWNSLFPLSESLESCSSTSEEIIAPRKVVGSVGSTESRSINTSNPNSQRPNRALINPFAPSSLHYKMSSTHRRWVHAFPLNVQGVSMQTHHLLSQTENEDIVDNTEDTGIHPYLPSSDQSASATAKTAPSDIVTENADIERTFLMHQTSRSSLRGEGSSDYLGSLPCSDASYSNMSNISTAQSNGSLGIHSKSSKSTPQTVCIWGPTGQQNWTPEITTGVDWKSLVIPAFLPITTDYFPDSHSLEYNYTQNQYFVTDDTLDTSADERDRSSRINKLFLEMISQRIGQGFQLVIKPRQSSPGQGEQPTQEHISMLRSRQRDTSKSKYYLSMGRIFHILELNEQMISVHIIKPRHPQPKLTFDYLYRFHVPDSCFYEISSTRFSSSSLDSYNWNYLDQYLLTCGAEDYGLVEGLKFWRIRFFILPSNSVATKKISDGSPLCDIYDEKCEEELLDLRSGFLKIIETLNCLKSPSSYRQPVVRKEEYQSKNEDDHNIDSGISGDQPAGLRSRPLQAVYEHMVHSSDGITCLESSASLPPNSFVSVTAVDWCILKLVDINDISSACALMQRLIAKGCICHFSGKNDFPFIYGFYIYTFSNRRGNAQEPVLFSPLVSDYWEVELPDALTPTAKGTSARRSSVQGSDVQMKNANLLIARELREEWATVSYQSFYDPICSFELKIQWLVATGCSVSEIVQNWARAIKKKDFHLFPVPVDPFALPHTENSDPLRGPIFIPLSWQQTVKLHHVQNVSSESSLDKGQTAESLISSYVQSLYIFQRHILSRFGFLRTQCRKNVTPRSQNMDEYVHCTGGMFAMIPNPSSYTYNLLQYFQISSDLEPPPKSEHIQSPSIGFLWAWNFMSSPRWRLPNVASVDSFLDKMLADFRRLCRNQDGRLLSLWTNIFDL